MNQTTILVIDAGLGNIGSVVAALKRHDCIPVRLQKPPKEESASGFTHAILPGVGSFAAGMEALCLTGWDEWIKKKWCKEGRPFLGICLGMQLLASEGTEGSSNEKSIAGLDLIQVKSM